MSEIEKNVEQIIRAVGENPRREGLLKTPERVAKAYEYLTSGYGMNLEEIVGDAIFNEENDGMIIARDIEVYSLCEHHMLPFYGRAHVGYIPSGKVIGLSKIPRIVDMFCRRLQIQERMTEQIRETLNDILQPKGICVVIRSKHMCMMMRGVEKQNSEVLTSSMSGVFKTQASTRSEFLDLIRS